MKKKKAIVISAVLIAVIAVVFVGMNMMNKSKAKMAQQAVIENRYEIYEVKKVPPLTMSGKVVSNKSQALVSPQGKLEELKVKDGQSVNEGDVILTVTDTSVQEGVANQKSVISKANRMVNTANRALKSAQQAYNQADDESKPALKEQLNKAQQDVDDANSDLTDENNKLSELQNKLHVNLKAPFAGVVAIDNNSKEGIPLVTINSKQKVLQASVSEYEYSKVKVGQPILIKGVDGSPEQKTTITQINSVPANQTKGTAYYSFSADVSDDFLYGQSVKLSIEQKGLKIPVSAVYDGHVFKVVNGKARKVKVDVTKSDDIYIVNSGIVQGEKIISNPNPKLKDGESIND